MNQLMHEDETVEDLQLGGLRLLQKKTGFRFGMDSVLLADFAAVRKDDTVADFGTGTGILPLLMIGREKGHVFTAIEIQQEYCDMASRTMILNHLEDRVSVVCGDAGDACRFIQRRQSPHHQRDREIRLRSRTIKAAGSDDPAAFS